MWGEDGCNFAINMENGRPSLLELLGKSRFRHVSHSGVRMGNEITRLSPSFFPSRLIKRERGMQTIKRRIPIGPGEIQ